MNIKFVRLAAVAVAGAVVVGACGTTPPPASPPAASSQAASPPILASPSPTADVDDLIEFGDPEDQYALLIPESWGKGRVLEPGVRGFGSGRGFGTRGLPALAISLGSLDGKITICSNRCRTVVVTTLEELGAEIVSVHPKIARDLPMSELSGDLTLGGAPGRYERPSYRMVGEAGKEIGLGRMTGGNCLGCPGMLYHAYAFHDGRPIVLAFDWWTIVFGTVGPSSVVEMIESFEWTAQPRPS